MGILDRITGRIERLFDEVVVADEARTAADLGAGLMERGDLDGAVRELEHALAIDSAYLRAWYLLGLCHARRGDHARAVAALERATGADGALEVLLALATVHRDAGDFAAARQTLRRALAGAAAKPETLAEIYRLAGDIHLREGNPDRAVRELRKAVAADEDYAEGHALLGQALLQAGDRDRARAALERATRGDTPLPGVLRTLGEAYLPDHPALAAQTFSRALAQNEHDAAALGGLARARLFLGDLPAALQAALQALAHAPRDAAAHGLVARVHAQARNDDAALAALDHALGAAGEAEVVLPDVGPLLPFALETALRVPDLARADAWAARQLKRAPDDATALAARGLFAVSAGDERGGELLRRSIAIGDNRHARLGLGRLALARGAAAEAATELRAALRLQPDDPAARALLTEAYRREALPAGGRPDLYVILRRLHDHLLAHREVGDLAPAAAGLVEIYDRPLLVTVMGEFNSGKSTFVNALLGEEVAPMGITPTTATINVLKYGAERMGRVLYRDDRSREVPWAEVPALLRGIDAEEARQIRVVEVLYPLDALARVNIVDTPGLNSIMAEHEQVARDFIAQADAVVWLFTVGQAGKQTEAEALAAIAREHKKILGVVNKVDRATPAEEAAILAHLQEEFGGLLEALQPFSAREALRGRQRSDAAQLAASRYAELQGLLEKRFYSRGRALKRASCAARAAALVRAGTERALSATAELDRALGALGDTGTALTEARRTLLRSFLPRERMALARDNDAGYRAAAREVLDFARPRRWPFGSNEAAPADRDFLLDLMDEHTESLVQASLARVLAELTPSQARVEEAVRGVTPALGGRASGTRRDPFAKLREEVYGRYRAFMRGYLRGGRVEDFFTRVLPRLELSETAIREALGRTGVDLETELTAPLEAFANRFFDDAEARLRALADEVRLRRFDLEERVFAPLEAFAAALAEAA
jgi:tetratricopeptide (TPR) repeat protein/GTP-binding protein EngB required for normal cell division